MTLSTERIKEMAVAFLVKLLEKEGKMNLDPSKIKRAVNETAKNFGYPKKEVAEFMKMIFAMSYEKTEIELNKIIDGKVEE